MNTFRRVLRILRRSPKIKEVLMGYPEEPLGLPVAENGGFYAAALLSTLNSRYTLIGKLGWGIHSSVWLARDIRQNHTHRSVAIKILSTHATQVQGRLAHELEILQRINNDNATVHPGRRHVSALLDNFTITDRHGPHLCLVFEALGAFKCSIYHGHSLPVPFVKSIARQLLLALDFLHRKCGIVHTDIKPDNILITLPNAAEAIQLYTAGVSESEAPPATPNSSPPASVVVSRPIIPFSLDELQNANYLASNCEIQLTDFGTAAMVDGLHADEIQPYALRAPEVILGNGWDTSADIWSLGCLIFELLTGQWLFSPRSGPTFSAESYHLAHMPGITEEDFDLEYIQNGKHFAQYFTPEGRLRIQVDVNRNLEQVLDVYHVLDDAEKPLFIDFLKSMLRLKPSDRASAAELLEHEWIKS